MKWRVVAASIMVALMSAGVFGYRTVTCSSWQEDYKRFIYTEIMKNSPVIYGPDDIEAIIGDRPAGCERPEELTDEELRRFRDEGIRPNHFVDRMRVTSRTGLGTRST